MPLTSGDPPELLTGVDRENDRCCPGSLRLRQAVNNKQRADNGFQGYVPALERSIRMRSIIAFIFFPAETGLGLSGVSDTATTRRAK